MGPVASHTSTMAHAIKKALGRPVHRDVSRAKRANHERDFALVIDMRGARILAGTFTSSLFVVAPYSTCAAPAATARWRSAAPCAAWRRRESRERPAAVARHACRLREASSRRPCASNPHDLRAKARRDPGCRRTAAVESYA